MSLGALIAIEPELILSTGAMLLLILVAFTSERAMALVSWLSVALLALAAATLLQAPAFGGSVFDGLVAADAFGAFAKLLVYAAAAASIIVAPGFFRRTGNMRAEYPLIIIFSVVGMSIMVSATDLLALYVGLELQSLAAYVLASFMRTDGRSAEAGLKYFVLGALASGILLYGISLLYGFAGTTGFHGIYQAIDATKGHLGGGLAFGLVFVLVGLAFKISAVPFHMWTPDVYEGAPTPVTAFFASAPKVAAMALTVRVAIDALGPGISWRPIVIFAALASIVWGAVAAPMQTNIKRLLAYSSINNVGFALIGLAAGTVEGVAAVLSYMAIYIVMTIGSFLCVLQMNAPGGEPIESIASLAGLSQTRKGMAFCFAVFMFSLAGIPPLFGFWAKFVVFDAAVAARLVPLATVGIAASVIGAFYYLKIIKTMYIDAPTVEYAETDRGSISYWLMWLCAAVIILGYFLIGLLDRATLSAAQALF